MKYSTNFELTHPVNDYDAAVEYLTEDDMTKYLLGDSRGCDKVTKVEWVLEDEMSGHIDVETSEPLTKEEKKNISSWISGQNSDGLGEGFEQQGFADVLEEYEWYDEDLGDYYTEEEFYMASFDWRTNDYELELVEE